ncbi:PREDICTED: putative GPI-anchored protein PB15E9.01c [Thamnophis sirtalis]|uniref:GPI-anchored protein PB15E9.01c n=1 Tax=Thamnophis sirtalis TaxID=35019 RepID=A0A6I9Y9A9_9SAUR|nr:PREDICTED: putative GPI-anchored protein PB15E9.01c [Thamnophis sirtalis]
MARSHLDPEDSTAIHPYEESVTASPPIHSLVALVGSSTQPSTTDSILQASRQLGDNFTTPLTSSSPPSSSTVEAGFSPDAANDGSDRMVPRSIDTIPTSVAGTPRNQVSLGVTQLAFATATVGPLKEANPSLEPPSSLLKEHIESFPTTLSFGTSKEDEISLVSHSILNSSLVEAIKLEPKDNTSSIVESLVGPTVSSIDGPISVSFQTNLLDTTDDRKPLETQHYGRKRQISASMEEIPTSKSPPTAMEADSVRKLTNVQPVDALPKRGTGAPPLSPLSSTTLMSKMRQTSKDSSEPETITDFLVTKGFSLGTTKTDSAVPSFPYLDIGDVLHPIGATSTRLTYTDLLEGYTTSPSVESLGSSSVEQKLSSPSQSHPTVSLPGLIEFDRSSVPPSHRSLSSSMTSIPFSGISVPETTSKTFINITEGHLVRIGQVMPRGTKSFSATPLPLESRSTGGGIALSLPTKVPRVGLRTSSEMATLENAMGHQVTTTSTANNIQAIGRSTLPIRSSSSTTSSNSSVPAYPSSVLETRSSQGTPIFSASATLWTTQRTLPVEPKTTCRSISCPVSISTPPQNNRSAQSMTPQPFLARKDLSTISGTRSPKESTSLAGASGSRSEERDATALPRTKIVTRVQQDPSSQQPSSKFTTSPFNPSAKEDLTLGTFASTVPAVRVLSLWFRLLKINYTNSLMNKSCESYRRLEKEIKLTLKKILSTYENFLHAKVLRFLNGSVVVESQVAFQATGLLPTPSDIIRTIVTEVESRKIDAFFDWRIDVRSLHLNGFGLKNLEPENLAVFFSLLELGSTFGDENFAQEHLESLKIKMKQLLGTRYAVHLISLIDNRYVVTFLGRINSGHFSRLDTLTNPKQLHLKQ